MTCWNYWGRVLSSFFYVFGNPGGGDRSVGNPRSSHFLLKSWDQSSLKLGVLRFLRVRWKSRGWRPECWKSQVITCLVEIIVFFLRIWKSRGRRPETRSSHVLLKSLGQSSLKFWVFFTCLVETQGAETGVLWTQLGVSRLLTIGRKSWGQRCEMKINIFLGKRWDRLACSAVVIAQLDDLCIVFWASVFHNPSKWNIVQQCTRSAVDFERWHSYNNNINRAGKH